MDIRPVFDLSWQGFRFRGVGSVHGVQQNTEGRMEIDMAQAWWIN
jgi:hypothetical protein